MSSSTIVILDFGAQYTQLIARRIREFNVFSVVLPCTAKLGEVLALAPAGVILSGGPSSVYDADAPKADPAVLQLGKPTLGICYGMQFMAHHLGGRVEPAAKREYGDAIATVTTQNKLFAGLPRELQVWMSHGDSVMELPKGFAVVAESHNALASIADESRAMYAVQWHPEVAHSKQGTELLRNFVFEICGAKADWTPEAFIQSTVAKIREQVGEDGHAICGLSGGVDSAVAAVLVARAIGDRLTCIFVNNGVLRKNEFEQVQRNMREKLGLKVVAVDASERFLSQLAGVTDPETKRKVIGREFISVFDDEAAKILREQEEHGEVQHDASGKEVAWLVQGTLYPIR